MGSSISSLASSVLPALGGLVETVADPVSALLPGTEKLFKTVSGLFKSASPESASHPAQKLVAELPATPPSGKREKMVRALELLLDELERV